MNWRNSVCLENMRITSWKNFPKWTWLCILCNLLLAPLKESAVSKVRKKAYCLVEKLCVWWIYCMFGYCVKNSVYLTMLTSHANEGNIIKMDWPAVSLGVLLSSSRTLSADAQLQGGKSLWGNFPPALMQSLQSKCSWNFHWSKSVTLRTNGEQTRQNNSSCYFSCKFTHIWCMQL